MVRSKQKHIIEDENGNYEITVKATEEIANVKIVLSNILAKVTMGGEEKEGQLEESIILPNGDTIKNNNSYSTRRNSKKIQTNNTQTTKQLRIRKSIFRWKKSN